MRLVMMGTGPFGAPTFRLLYETQHELIALVTRPAKDRGKELSPVSPTREIALEHLTPIFDPEDINMPEAQEILKGYQADLYVVCDYGQILSSETLATARLGGINLHASLLPRYRGAAPINWAIYHGEPETGVSVIHMTPQVDAGPIIAQGRTDIEPLETAVQLETRLAEIGAWLVRRSIDSLESGSLEALPQNAALACKAPRLKKTDGLVDWSRPAEAIRNQIRAMEPWPKAYTFWRRPKGAPLRLILGPIMVEAQGGTPVPGEVLEARGDRLVIASGMGAAVLTTVQPSGKKVLSIAEFLRGYHVQPGEWMGTNEEAA